jgi:hypothetical protein
MAKTDAPPNPLKIFGYPDVPLLVRAMWLQQQIAHREGRELLKLVDVPVKDGGRVDPERVIRYVAAACRVGGMFGYLNTCLARSVVACRILRESGMDARVVFGVRTTGELEDGHCWLGADGKTLEECEVDNYARIMIAPEDKAGKP